MRAKPDSGTRGQIHEAVSLQAARGALFARRPLGRSRFDGASSVGPGGVVHLARRLSFQAADLGPAAAGGIRLGVAAVIPARPGACALAADRPLLARALS